MAMNETWLNAGYKKKIVKDIFGQLEKLNIDWILGDIMEFSESVFWDVIIVSQFYKRMSSFLTEHANGGVTGEKNEQVDIYHISLYPLIVRCTIIV